MILYCTFTYAAEVDDVVLTTVIFGCCTLFVVHTGVLGVNETVLNGQSTVSVSEYFNSAVFSVDVLLLILYLTWIVAEWGTVISNCNWASLPPVTVSCALYTIQSLSVLLLYSILKYVVSVEFTSKVTVGVAEPFPQEPKVRSTTPPEQPQSTVSLASTVSQSWPTKSPPLVVSFILHVIVFPSGTNTVCDESEAPAATDMS